MIDALLSDAALLAAIHGVHGGGDAAEAVARITWSVLAEPGDGVAGALIRELGATEALRVVLGSGRRLVAPGTLGGPVAEGIARWSVRADPQRVRCAVTGARDVGARLIVPGDPEWPLALNDLGVHAPVVLWVRGDRSLLVREPRVAVVGARAASAYGDSVAAELAGDLAIGGAVIVSGGAYGIDGAAHRAALAVGGATVAFLAGGVDRAYPQGHQELLRRIVETGAVISEVPCGMAPTKWRFLSRNRLIAAASQATVVVEAGWRSGSLNTAGHAASLGRPLGAVPGPVTSASSAGCHRLLREYDARCVTSAGEVRELWGSTTSAAAGVPEERIDAEQRRLLDAVGARTWVTATEIAGRAGLAPGRVTALLGVMDLEGLVERSEAGWRRKRETGRRG
nr:DNA-processing protein DprA [Microbacterium hydrocarbonoxydans]